VEEIATLSEEDDSSEGEFLSMGKSKASLNKKPTKASTLKPADNVKSVRGSSEKKTVVASQSRHNLVAGDTDDDEEEDMFVFEGGGGIAENKELPRPTPEDAGDSEEDEQQESVASESKATPRGLLHTYSGSPARDISRHQRSVHAALGSPIAAKFQPGSVGSYKGRSITMPVVVNPDIHELVASQGEFNTFVGGLDGRSGVDEGDLNSFRQSLTPIGFSGTPRSMTERMMMEDMRVLREGNSGAAPQ
jgi:hypothetical protein